MSLPETFYIALCVTILLIGVVYWFWTQVQYLQRKVNLLDNVVYEIKTLVSNLPGSGPPNKEEVPAFTTEQEPVESYAPPPESVAGDLENERQVSEQEFEHFSGETAAPETKQTYDEPVFEEKVIELQEEKADDLQPGGLAEAAKPGRKSDAAIESPLNAMSLKELKRMAEANNIPGASDLKKKDLIRLLRDKVSTLINEQPKIISFDEVASPTFD